ncbi:gamma-glutamyltransferase [Sphingomicrobium sp. XHP0235]|uniref:gamma-glutamyltransferase n=1 Tax=Sphingomicrobium aquimarinum TaxID=3133971 RepID=UPI0031FE8D5C
MLRTIFAFATLSLTACATTPTATPSSQPPSAVVTGAVSSAEPRATAAGEAMLAQGGSATDAAIAVMLALTVVEPQSSGIGGGGFMLHSAANGPVTSYDGRETAPMAADENWFLGEDGETLGFREVVPGGKSVGVPGNIALAAMVHERHGRLDWAALFEPAIRLAREGWPMTERLRSTLEGSPTAPLTAAARDLYYDGEAPKPVGTRLTNPRLAATLERLAELGPEAFYAGRNAEDLRDAVAMAPVAPADMTLADIEAYRAKERLPVCGTYRHHEICSMGPPSSGATTVLQILGLLERFDIGSMGPDDPDFWHLFAEATRLAFADRGAYLGDHDFVPVPVPGLFDKAYLAERSQSISLTSAMDEARAGYPPGNVATAFGQEPRESGTSHFAIADDAGNVVSYTSTIESAFGSGLMVGGYFLNNELTDFSFDPVGPGGVLAANRVQPGKRPRSSMSPAIVFGPDGEALLGVGAAGGATIIAQTAKTIIAVIDFEMDARQAIALRNVYAPGGTVLVEEGEGADALAAALTARGHGNVRVTSPRFKANAVHKIGGRWIAAFDPRTEKDVRGVALP